PLERRPRRLLLGRLLRLARAEADLLAVDRRGAREAPVVRRALDLDDAVADLPAAPRERFLELRLVVDVAGRRVLDPILEGLHDRLLDVVEPVLEEKRRKRRLEERREDVAVLREPLELVGRNPARALDEPPPEPELGSDDGAARPRDDVGADLGKAALGEVREAVVEGLRDRELEHAVAEELEALVRRRAVGRPRGMREDGLEPPDRQRLEQALQLDLRLVLVTDAR